MTVFEVDLIWLKSACKPWLIWRKRVLRFFPQLSFEGTSMFSPKPVDTSCITLTWNQYVSLFTTTAQSQFPNFLLTLLWCSAEELSSERKWETPCWYYGRQWQSSWQRITTTSGPRGSYRSCRLKVSFAYSDPRACLRFAIPCTSYPGLSDYISSEYTRIPCALCTETHHQLYYIRADFMHDVFWSHSVICGCKRR